MNHQKITVAAHVARPIALVWKKWTTPADIMAWNNASEDWYTPSAENDLRPGGAFNYKMAARDGSFGFDFAGVYDEVIEGKKIAYTLGDGRKVSIAFLEADGGVSITESFDAEELNSPELQRAGWQAILDNFKKYAEAE